MPDQHLEQSVKRDDRDKELILLHNFEEVNGMFGLLPMLYYDAFFKQFKNMDIKPTAMVCCNDRYAIQFMIGLKSLGYEVPQDIAVSGFDNLKEASYFYPALTTVEGNRSQLGSRAADQIVKRISAPNEQYELVRLQTTPIYRDSTKRKS